MSANETAFQEIVFVHPGSPDWTAAKADLERGIEFEDINGPGLGGSLEDTYDQDMIEAAADPEAETVRQAMEVMEEDLRSCQSVWESPEDFEDVTVADGQIRVRGQLYPGPGGYRSAYWSFYRMLDMGVLHSAGLEQV